jgi:hypothetical protein
VIAREKLAETIFDSLSAMMGAYSEEAVRCARIDHQQHLDLSESSIESLETILAGQAATDLDFQTRLWGSYFGEVIRRRFGGEWELTLYPGGAAAVPTLLIGESRLYPLMKVYRRLTMGDGENLSTFYKLVSGRLREKLAQRADSP